MLTLIRTACIECAAPLALDSNTEIGEIISCGDCSVELEVLNTNPMELALAPEVAEDWGE